jgi:hypothetical protein
MTSPPLQPPRYWTGLRLAPKLAVLLAQLTSLPDAPDEFRKRKANFEQLPFSLGGMSYSFFEFVRIQADLAARWTPEAGATRVLSSDEADPLAYLLDAFLDHARRVANGTIPYLSARYRLSLPSSMRKLAERLESDLTLLPNERSILQVYWVKHGLKVRDYRDLAQHHALLASDCRVLRGANGEPAIYLAIPNNPEIKNASMLSYENPTVHAFLFMRRVFYDTITFVHQLSTRLLDPTQPSNVASVGPNIRGWISGARQEGVKIATMDTMDGGVRTLLDRLARDGTSAV